MLGKKGKNQFSKAEELGLETPKVSEETRLKLSSATRNKNLNESNSTKEKRRNTIAKKVEAGEWHTSLAKRMHYFYNGVDLHGKWELAFAVWCDANHVKWERCKQNFRYTFLGKSRRYTPDFYLPETDVFVEIKGYKTEKDDAKWEQFPKEMNLKIFMGKDLKELGIEI